MASRKQNRNNMKLLLARLAKWLLILVVIVACLCFETLFFFQNESTYNRPFYVGAAIWFARFLRAFFWPRQIDLPFAILFWLVVALLFFLCRKMSLARMKKQWLLWAGIVAGLGLGVWEFFQSTNPYAHPPFYAVPFFRFMQALVPLVKPSAQSPLQLGFFITAMFLCFFTYFAVLGALLGLLFQLLLRMFRRLRRHGPADRTKT
jgi:hypothetical protein